jgi:hypothetical protein
VHEDGFHVQRQRDGELEFRRPDGRVLPHAPALPAVSSDGLTSEHVAAGVSVDGRGLTATGTGERLDLGYAIDVLHPRAIGS